MDNRQIQFRLGLIALAMAALLIFYFIPYWVSSPSNVRNVILSPLFWPYVLSGLTALIGLGLLITGLRSGTASGTPIHDSNDDTARGWMRLGVMALIMILTMALIGTVGMVWTSIAVFLATAFLVRTRHPILAVVCGIAIPLLLYAFFAHVAGVAIPQGDFVRLP